MCAPMLAPAAAATLKAQHLTEGRSDATYRGSCEPAPRHRGAGGEADRARATIRSARQWLGASHGVPGRRYSGLRVRGRRSARRARLRSPGTTGSRYSVRGSRWSTALRRSPARRTPGSARRMQQASASKEISRRLSDGSGSAPSTPGTVRDRGRGSSSAASAVSPVGPSPRAPVQEACGGGRAAPDR